MSRALAVNEWCNKHIACVVIGSANNVTQIITIFSKGPASDISDYFDIIFECADHINFSQISVVGLDDRTWDNIMDDFISDQPNIKQTFYDFDDKIEVKNTKSFTRDQYDGVKERYLIMNLAGI